MGRVGWASTGSWGCLCGTATDIGVGASRGEDFATPPECVAGKDLAMLMRTGYYRVGKKIAYDDIRPLAYTKPSDGTTAPWCWPAAAGADSSVGLHTGSELAMMSRLQDPA
jgi:hypothetical protein